MNACMHAHIQTYIHYTYTYMHARTHTHTYIHIYKTHTYKGTCLLISQASITFYFKALERKFMIDR